jgi:light-regulated signal transduction histidine kinase (bacteriophytochrome)
MRGGATELRTAKGEIMRDLRAAIRNQPPAEHQYDWDPLHTPGSIQPYGVLLVADPETRHVRFASENAGSMLGIPAEELIDRSYLTLCDSERDRRMLKDSVGPDTILFPNPIRIAIKGKPFDAVFHAHGGTHLIEIEPASPDDTSYSQMADRAVEELFDPGSVDELYQRAVRVVREVTGFDRVMLYRFDARYNGQVLAESSREGIGSFLGLFFPSSDIGARARELYLKNFTRYIPDIGAAPVGLVGKQPGGVAATGAHSVDMTFCNLRSVVPCHITYLKNIGVKASMSFSINVDNRLWGLFACHHYAPRRVTYDQRVVCEQAAMMFIFKLNSLPLWLLDSRRDRVAYKKLGGHFRLVPHCCAGLLHSKARGQTRRIRRPPNRSLQKLWRRSTQKRAGCWRRTRRAPGRWTIRARSKSSCWIW